MNATDFSSIIRITDFRTPLALRFYEQGGIVAVRFLRLLCQSYSQIRFPNESDKGLMFAIALTGEWGFGSQGRTLTLSGLHHVPDVALDQLARGVEYVEPACEHGAKELRSSRQKKRHEAAAKIIAAVVTPELQGEAQDWGFAVGGQFHDYAENPYLRFTVVNGKRTLGSVELDGWNGLLKARIEETGDSLTELRRYMEPSQIQKLLRLLIDDRAQALTAV